MTSLLEPIIGETYTAVYKDSNHNIRHRHYRNVLRSKENLNKHKCKKILKRKLKKYKLRQDGKEDQDIIDVSETLLSTLFIRSPNKAKDNLELELDGLVPKNYLFKMGRRKKTTIKTTKTSKSPDIEIKGLEDEVFQMSPATEEKKQTNAFKLLMDSRNKSLGSNSPGKERPIDEIETQELVEKKNNKAKRTLILQRMAEEKGSLKKKEVEEQHEKYIKKKMEKRAEQLKTMIINKQPKTVDDKRKKNVTVQNGRSPLDNIDTEKNGKVFDTPKTLQLVNIFNEEIAKKISPGKKLELEDEEFLKKLSPSLRKKESMLSYFKKVEKDSDCAFVDSENDNEVIKVKFGSKKKKRGRKKKLSLIKVVDSSSDVPENEIEPIEFDENVEVLEIIESQGDMQLSEKSDTTTFENNKERRKRKREAKEGINCGDSPLINISSNHEAVRPQRTVKKPIKYDVVISSSDEELHIFTPKKKKHTDQKYKSKTTVVNVIKIDQEQSKLVKKSVMSKREKISNKEKKPVKDVNPPKPLKLAPIFTKSQPDPAVIEAKQKFLQSGVPEQLKKLVSKQKDCNTVSNCFPRVVHVQQILQLDTTLPDHSVLNWNANMGVEEITFAKSDDAFAKILDLSMSQSAINTHSKIKINIQTILQNLKEAHPKFPVYRTYKLLRSKKKGEFNNIFGNLDNSIEILNCSIDMQNDNPDQLTWSDKYKPLSGKEIIGNFESIKELKKWLITWTENDNKSKVNKLNDSDSSDYYQSEPDSRDSMKSNNNLLVLSGPVGTGKTSCVYAVAAELSMKVIEVNASSKRTGKIMLQDLQEATQSHKVNRGTGSAENSQKQQEIVELPSEVKVKKRGRPKKIVEQPTPKKLVSKDKPEVTNGLPASQESTRTAMSLILIDDVDIVFDQDDGFCSAIMQLVQSSKRPVILITGSLSLPHLQRFLQSSKVLKMQPLLPNILGTWLDLMCLADSGTCWPGLGAKFLNFFKGDMRKSINCLQFYVGSQEQTLNVERNSQTDSQSDVKINADNENSCMSWADRDSCDEKNMKDAWDTDSQSVWDTFVNEYKHLKHMKYPLKVFDVWWSIPKVFYQRSKDQEKDLKQIANDEKVNKDTRPLDSICNVLDLISVCDYFSHIKPETEANMTSHPWYDSECNSVSELENSDYYDRNYETNNVICYELVKSSVATAQSNMGLENSFNLDFPGMSAKRQRDRIVNRHNNLSSYLNPQSSLDRKALALDYWPSCRDICRIEKSKTDSNSKRNNRFCHYLKSLSVLCKSDSFDNLANSLSSSVNT